jgi:hypothetical protein
MRAPDDLPEELEGDYRAGEIRDTRTAPECVERDRYSDDDDPEWVIYHLITRYYEAEDEPCPPN